MVYFIWEQAIFDEIAFVLPDFWYQFAYPLLQGTFWPAYSDRIVCSSTLSTKKLDTTNSATMSVSDTSGLSIVYAV